MIQWTPDLSVGVEKIDLQHQELFSRINDLVEAIKSKTCKYRISDVIKFLEDYMNTHFGEEERYMKYFEYPEAKAHFAEHAKFRENFKELKEELIALEQGKRQSSYDLSVQTNQVVVDWIIEHVKGVDMKLGNFLKNKVA